MDIIRTEDGSHTIFVRELDEHYHSVNGAAGESMHVFIHAGFNHIEKETIRVLEIGFGTGLNAFLTFLEAKKRNIKVIYETIEWFPLGEDIFSQLNFTQLSGLEDPNGIFLKLHRSPWDQPVFIDKDFLLKKYFSDLTRFPLFDGCDVIYFDAFAPQKQPELWSQEIFEYLYPVLSAGGVLTTYCAKGEIKRRLKKAGFRVESLPGFAKKREMVRAIKSY